MRVLFMGTPEFAAVSLERLLQEEDLELFVVTTPDKPQGRHMTLTPSAVKKTALAHGLPLFQPERLKEGQFLNDLQRVDPEIVLVVAYGKILPGYLLGYPKLGCINLHGSLLPAMRGAAPMQRTILAGAQEYGVTTMYMAQGLDTGDMLEKWSAPLRDEDDFQTVHDVLARQGAELLVSTLRKAQKGLLRPEKQDEALASFAPKIEKEDCLLDFSGDARSLHNRVRGLSPVPLAFTLLRGKNLKIVKSRIVSEEGANGEAPGTVLETDSEGFTVSCGRGVLQILTVRPEGKGTMSAADFVKGRGIRPGDVLGKTE